MSNPNVFKMLVLGDSVTWGQGLLEEQKFSTLVGVAIASQPGVEGVETTVLAHSGAIIGLHPYDPTSLPPLDGEVPSSYPTIVQQAAAFSDPPAEIDLILLDGGINDVGPFHILDPLISTDDISDLAEHYCHLAMRQLLQTMTGTQPNPLLVTPVFANAKIIVSGYYQIFSEQSDEFLLAAYLFVMGLLEGTFFADAAELQRVIENCLTFAEQANLKLQQAVDEANAALGGPARIFFANPGFGPANAIAAPDSFIFAINPPLYPADDPSVAEQRALACAAAGSTRTNIPLCLLASAGHPNPSGAQAYADAIIPLL